MTSTTSTEFTVTIPDDLLAWGRLPEVVVRQPRPWAAEIDELIAKGTLDTRETRVLMARLEALCAEAVRAGHAELVGGLDTFTAEHLGVSYAFTDDSGRKIEIGRGKRYTWGEMRAVLATNEPKDAMRAVDRVKDLLADVFPTARVANVSDMRDEDPVPCASCGDTTCQVMMTTTHGSHYCGSCWSGLTDSTPVNFKRKTTTIRGRR